MTLATLRPGLVIAAAGDPFTGGHEKAQTVASRTMAEFALSPDVGHWWMLEKPELGARTLEIFWNGL